MSNIKYRVFITIGAAILSFSANSVPLSVTTAEQYFVYQNLNDMIQVKNVNFEKFRRYAVQQVDAKLQGQVVPVESRTEVTKNIEKIYHDFVQSQISLIKQNAVQNYKQEFQKNMTEESVKAQLDFYQTVNGKSILSKQKIRRQDLQKITETLSEKLSQQLELQNLVRNAIVTGVD